MTIELSTECIQIISALFTLLVGSYAAYFKYSEVLRDRIAELKHLEFEKNKKKNKGKK